MSGSKFITGVAIGVILGILFAPDAGKNTRKKMKSFKGKVEDLAHSAASSVEGFTNDAKDMVNAGRNKVDNWKSKIGNSTV